MIESTARKLAVTLAAAALVLTGCMASPEYMGQAEGGLIEVPGDTEPLALVSSDAWHEAPPDCEGQLEVDGLKFEVASVDAGLIAAVDQNGDIVCVDTVGGVQEELSGAGRAEDAAALGASYLLMIGLATLPSTDDLNAGDPSPQPSINAGDPSPQPSSQADEGGGEM